jgi:uncharacterized membrane protein YczE
MRSPSGAAATDVASRPKAQPNSRVTCSSAANTRSESRRKALGLALDLFLVSLGLTCLSLGTAIAVSTPWGAQPWDVFHLGLAGQMGLSIGRASQLVGACAVILTLLLRGKTISWLTLVNAIVIGFQVDFFLTFIPAVTGVAGLLYLELGVVLLGLGMGLYLAPEWGAGPRDSLLLTVVRLTGAPLTMAYVVQDVLVVTTGYLLGGPVGLGTILAASTAGPWSGLFVHRLRAWRGEIMRGLSVSSPSHE